MASPCCGLVGKVDVLENNLVHLNSRKGNPEDSASLANRTKLTTEDCPANARPHESVGKGMHRKATSSPPSSRSHRNSLVSITSLQHQASKNSNQSSPNSLRSKIPENGNAFGRKTLALVLSTRDYSSEELIKEDYSLTLSETGSCSSELSNAQQSYVSKFIDIPMSHTQNSQLRPPCRAMAADNVSNSSHVHPRSQDSDVPDEPDGGGRSVKDDSQESEWEIEGAICLSSFTFGSRSQSLPFSESNTSRMLQLLGGKKAHVRQLSSESCMSMLSLDYSKDKLSESGPVEPLPSFYTHADFSSKEESEFNSSGHIHHSLVCFHKGKDDLTEKAEEPCFQIESARKLQELKSKKEGKRMRFSNIASPPVRWKAATQNQHFMVLDSENSILPHGKNKKRLRSVASGKHLAGNRKSKKATSNLLKRRGLAAVGHKRGVGLEGAFNLGVGIGVSYMLVANRKEVERLNTLLEQTQSLVKEMKQQVQSGRSPIPICFSNSRSPGIRKPEAPKHERGETFQNKLEGKVHDSGLEANHAVESISESIHMAELEAALEAELSLMQLNLAAESEAGLGDFDEWNVNVSPNELASIADVRNLDQDDTTAHSSNDEVLNFHYALSPGALDRRLHEVLEAQQEERIMELEAQINAAEINLVMKEKELQCWKDIAHELIESSHVKSGECTKNHTTIRGGALFLAGKHAPGLTVTNGKPKKTLKPVVTKLQHNTLYIGQEGSRQQFHANSLHQQCEDIKSIDFVAAPSYLNKERAYDCGLSATHYPCGEGFSDPLDDPSFEAFTSTNTAKRPFGDAHQQRRAVSAWKKEIALSVSSGELSNYSNEPLADQDVDSFLKALEYDKSCAWPWPSYEDDWYGDTQCLETYLHIGESGTVTDNSLHMDVDKYDCYSMSAAKASPCRIRGKQFL